MASTRRAASGRERSCVCVRRRRACASTCSSRSACTSRTPRSSSTGLSRPPRARSSPSPPASSSATPAPQYVPPPPPPQPPSINTPPPPPRVGRERRLARAAHLCARVGAHGARARATRRAELLAARVAAGRREPLAVRRQPSGQEGAHRLLVRARREHHAPLPVSRGYLLAALVHHVRLVLQVRFGSFSGYFPSLILMIIDYLIRHRL